MMLIPMTIINILGAILLTSVTGGIMMLLAMTAGTLLERWGFMHMRFELLKGVAFFFLCPVAYIIVKVFEMEVGRGFLFSPTPTITQICNILFNAWCVGVILIVSCMVFDLYKLKGKFKDTIICDKIMQDIFESVKLQLGLEKCRIALGQSYHAKVPCVMGIIHPRIILPIEKYSKEELCIILTHELTHYRQKDIWLKQISFCIVALHFYNPLAWLFFGQVQKQSEYVCDYRSCLVLGNIKKYFEVIMQSATDENLFSALSSQLFERKHEIVERVKKMNQISKIRKRSKLAVTFVLIMATLSSNISVYAATMEGVEQYLAWYEATDVIHYVERQPMKEYEEIVGPIDEEGVVVVVGEVDQVTRATGNILWDVNHNVKMCTAYFDCEEDALVDAFLIVVPSDANVTVGIESMDGELVSIRGSDRIFHTFEVPSAGLWRFFVLNQSGENVSVEGSYRHE